LNAEESKIYKRYFDLGIEREELWQQDFALNEADKGNTEEAINIAKAIEAANAARQEALGKFEASYFRRILESEITAERAQIAINYAVGQHPDRARVSVKLNEFSWVPSSVPGEPSVPKAVFTIKVNTDSGPDFKKTIQWSPEESKAEDP
jgi:hypothetical protein